jgi:hypothetical protein
VTLSGAFKSKLARGTIRMTAEVNENDEIERGGPITCNSGAVRWTARRR